MDSTVAYDKEEGVLIVFLAADSVASLGGTGGPPRVTPSRGVTPEGKKFVVGKFTKNSGETRSDR